MCTSAGKATPGWVVTCARKPVDDELKLQWQKGEGAQEAVHLDGRGWHTRWSKTAWLHTLRCVKPVVMSLSLRWGDGGDQRMGRVGYRWVYGCGVPWRRWTNLVDSHVTVWICCICRINRLCRPTSILATFLGSTWGSINLGGPKVPEEALQKTWKGVAWVIPGYNLKSNRMHYEVPFGNEITAKY